MKRDGVLIVMRGEYLGGEVGSWRVMYARGDEITNKLYRYSSWDQLESELHHQFELDHKELRDVLPALAAGRGSVHIDATPKPQGVRQAASGVQG
jgi:hypothetical protein